MYHHLHHKQLTKRGVMYDKIFIVKVMGMIVATFTLVCVQWLITSTIG